MTADPLAPQRTRHPVPPRRQLRQPPTARHRAQRPHRHPGRLQLALHPLHPHRRVLRRHLQRRRQLRPRQLARRLQPPQRQQLPVALVQPAGRLRDLPPLLRQPQPDDRQPDEVRRRIGHRRRVRHRLRRARALVAEAAAHLVHRDRHQPAPEPRRIPQPRQAVHRPQHGLLHHVVGVRMPRQGPADHVVHQRQVTAHQLRHRLPVAVLRPPDQRRHPPTVHSPVRPRVLASCPHTFGDPPAADG